MKIGNVWRGLGAIGAFSLVLGMSEARGQETPPGCSFSGAGAAITRSPSGPVNHGDKICYTVQYNNGTVNVNCELRNFDADLFLADGSVIPLLDNATIASGGSVICPSADPRCLTPSNCTIPGQVGYEYIVDHADEVASFNACPPTFTPGTGRIVAYTYGEGDSLTLQGDFANACATANNIVPHGSCCEPCTGTCTDDGTCNECPGGSVFTLDGDCGTSCLLTCGDADACTTDGVCIPGSGRDNCAATPGGTPATCGPNVHFCDVAPPDFTCDDANECTTDTCLDDTDPNNPCCSNEPIDCPPVPCMRSTGCNPATGCTYTADCREGTDCCPADSDLCDTESCDPSTGICGSSPICEKGEICCANGESCDDGDECTEDVCADGCCENRPITCNDGDACTTDTCDSAIGCVYTPLVCDDSDTCTTDDCVGGICVYTEIECDDNDACTTDACVDGICVYTDVICDDGDACTTDVCKHGVCEYVAIDCDDDDACTTDTCKGGTCVHDPVDFDDNDLCTIDACDPATGPSHTPVLCDDRDECTRDACDPSTGECVYTPIDPPPAGCAGGDGCTPGFWRQKHHFQYWIGYSPNDLYDTVFGVTSTFAANTLFEVVVQGGGGEKAFGRHAVAALLNSTNNDVDYAFDTAQVIAMVQAAYASGDFETAKDILETENERGCTVVKSNDDDGGKKNPRGR